MIRRWTPYLLVAALLAALIVSLAAAKGATPRPDPPPPGALEGSAACPGARRAIHYYRAAYTEHRRTMHLRGAVPFVRYGCQATRRRAAEWRERAGAARLEAHRWLYDWRSWLPRNWYLLGSCETGYGGDPNWEHSNRQFTSAFGISWAEYNADAAYMGAPPWKVRHAPRDQYLAALGHYARFGDGWGCSGP